MDDEDRKFVNKDELQVWLERQGVHREFALEVAGQLYHDGFVMPSTLVGATPDMFENVPRPIAQHLSNKLSKKTNADILLPTLTTTVATLNLVAEEVNRSRRKRLNCWERESARTTGSNRSAHFRQKVINYYKRKSSSGKNVKCQILDVFVSMAEAQNTIFAAHIWKASTRGNDLDEFGLSAADVNDARNGMFLTKGIEDAFDNQQVCFLYNILDGRLHLWVADKSIMSETIEGSKPLKHFSEVHQKPLCCPPDRLPFRRLLSWHARLSLELRKENIEAVPNFTSEHDRSPGRDLYALDPISRAINEMVEPGEDASVSD